MYVFKIFGCVRHREQRCDPVGFPDYHERPKGYAERYALALASRRAPREGRKILLFR